MVNEGDLYTLKINCKGKKSIRKANKIINVEKNNRLFFKLKIKTIKREKKKKGRRKVKEIIIIIKKKLHRTAKVQVEAEVYNNNKKMWLNIHIYIFIQSKKNKVQ